MTVDVRWQAVQPIGIGHAYLTLRPGTPPVCGALAPAEREQFTYPLTAKCTKCLAYESAPVKRRVARVHV